MSKRKVGILTECMCDLPRSVLYEYDVDLVFPLIETEHGIFTDTDEITSENVLEYIEAGGGAAKSTAPLPEVYRNAFKRTLKKYDEVIHVATSSGVSESFVNSSKAVETMGELGNKVHVFDSGHLSSGLGLIVQRAAELANWGKSSEDIIAELNDMKTRVCTTFIARNADYLYLNGHVSKTVKALCGLLQIHPVLIMKNGNLTLKDIELGDYSSSVRHYIRSVLRNPSTISKKRCYITHVGCSVKRVEMIKQVTEECCKFEEMNTTKASATISANCGPDTFGVLFVYDK
ncbi:MAG: DegV family protein [Huintestinicola sp.]